MENKKYTLEILSNKLSKEDIFSKLKQLMKGKLVEAKNPSIKFKKDGVLIADKYGKLFQLKDIPYDSLKENNISICSINIDKGIIEFRLPKDKNKEYSFDNILEFFEWSFGYLNMTKDDITKYNLEYVDDIYNKVVEHIKEESDMVMCFYWPE